MSNSFPGNFQQLVKGTISSTYVKKSTENLSLRSLLTQKLFVNWGNL